MTDTDKLLETIRKVSTNPKTGKFYYPHFKELFAAIDALRAEVKENQDLAAWNGKEGQRQIQEKMDEIEHLRAEAKAARGAALKVFKKAAVSAIFDKLSVREEGLSAGLEAPGFEHFRLRAPGRRIATPEGKIAIDAVKDAIRALMQEGE